MTEYVECYLNGRWPLMVPDFRKEHWDARPKWEIGRMESCAETMQEGMVVFDCGAEHGDMTSAYRSWVGDTGDVIPIEPAPHYWEYIRGTWEANGFSTPPAVQFCGLIGSTSSGFAGGLHLGDWCPNASTEGVPDGGFVHLKHRPKTGTPVGTIDVLSQYIQPDVLVLDIEGAEFEALSGAMYTLTEIRPLVYVSVHDIGDGEDWPGATLGWYGKTVEDIHSLMAELDYTATELPWNGEGEHFWYYEAR